MLQKFVEMQKVVSLSLAVLITGLTVGGVSQVADSQYNQAKVAVQQQMAQQVAIAKLSTRSGAVNA